MANQQGIGSMAPARLPGSTPGLMEIGPPMYGPNAPAVGADASEEPIIGNEEAVSEIEKLLGKFYQEIDIADEARRPKEWKWIKIDKYLAGKDSQDPPEGYEESTFFYRRLPRICQIAKAKIFKHICPIHGRPWEVRPSPRHAQNVAQDEQKKKLSALREEIEDIHGAMEMECALDDMSEFLAAYGSTVAYGPIQLSEPRLKWQDGGEGGGREVPDPEDAKKPMWKFYDPRWVYPDPNGKKAQELEYIHFYHVWSKHQLRQLQNDKTFIKKELADLIEDMKDGNWSGNLKRWEIAPLPANLNSSALNRYQVWMRVGVLDGESLKTLEEHLETEDSLPEDLKAMKDLDEDQKMALTDSIWEIWFCGKHVIKVSKRKFQESKIPVYFIPFRRDPTSIFGIGAGESSLECVEMLINITRSIDDALADTSGFQVMIDAAMVENKDLTVRGRKTWLYRNKGKKDQPANHKPVDFFNVPSNLEHLLACFKLFEQMLPICNGIPEMVTGQDMGSGVRTDGMMNGIWASLEEFIKDTVGNVDRYWWKPHLRDTYQWIQRYYVDREDLKVDADLQVQGVRGALRREIVGQKAQDFFLKSKQFGQSAWTDEKELLAVISEGMGMEDEKAVFTGEQYAENQAMLAKQRELEARSGRVAEDEAKDKERAHTSSRDAVLATLTHTLTADVTSPMLPVLYEEMLKLSGQLSPRAMAGLSILCKKIASLNVQAGFATEQEAQVLEAPVKASNPLELEPGSRNPEQAAQAAEMGTAPKTPPNSPPPMPTSQQVVGQTPTV